MASILSSVPEISDVVLYELLKEYGHCRVQATTLLTAAFVIGTVVQNDGDGTYSGVAAADVATLDADVAVVIDDGIYGVTGDTSITLLQMPAGGVAGVKDIGLAYLDALSAGQKTTVQTALAVKGIKTIATV